MQLENKMNKEQTVNYFELFKTIDFSILDKENKVMCLHMFNMFEERFKYFKMDTKSDKDF